MKPRKSGRIAVLTSGGDAPGLNAVVRAVVKTSHSRGYEVLGIARGFEGLIGEPDYKVLTSADVRGILPLGGTILQTTNKGHFGGQRVIGAEDDIITPSYFSEELARLIPGAEIKIFPRGGHSLTQVRPREFSQAVLPFLASHTPG